LNEKQTGGGNRENGKRQSKYMDILQEALRTMNSKIKKKPIKLDLKIKNLYAFQRCEFKKKN